MPYALVIVGLLMIITGINNTYSQFAGQLQNDVGGSRGFLVWAIALGAVGALGYINDLRTFSHYFMALILISFVLSNKGVFANLQSAIARGPVAPQASAQPGSLSASSSTSDLNAAITSNQQNLAGENPSSPGQAKFNGWMNWIFGTGTNSSGNAP